MLYFQLPLIKPYVQFSRIRLSNHLLPQAFAGCVLSPAWPSGIVSSEVPESSPGFQACRNPLIPSLLQKHDEGIAPSLSQVYALLRCSRYYGRLRLPCKPHRTSALPYIYKSPLCMASARVSRATPYGFLCVSPLLPRKSTYWFWQFSLE